MIQSTATLGFSALQRAEIAEIWMKPSTYNGGRSFSALQRAEIAEIAMLALRLCQYIRVSVLFNEPKLLKSAQLPVRVIPALGVSVLFNEPKLLKF